MQRETATISKMAHEFSYTIRICNAEHASSDCADDTVLMFFVIFICISFTIARRVCINIVHRHLILDNGSLFESLCAPFDNFYGAVNCCIEHCVCECVRDGAQMLITTINEIHKCLTPFAKCKPRDQYLVCTHEHSIFPTRNAVDIR